MSIQENLEFVDLEIGMPHTGVNGLAESPLLKFLGDLRWKQIGHYCGVPTKDIVNADGQRLYATFYFTEIVFPANTLMSDFGENDKLRIYSTLRRFGRSIIDGEYYLLPHSQPLGASKTPFRTQLMKFPYVRLSNTFVHQRRGVEWLKKSRPIHKGLDLIPETDMEPDTYSISNYATAERIWEAQLPKGCRPLTEIPISIEYSIVPDRDLNGVGLIYFANYPQILDICERKALLEINSKNVSEDDLDKRTVIERKSVYFSNANRRDTLVVEIKGWIADQIRADDIDPELTQRYLFFTYKMFRKSDNRLMMYSTATKSLPLNLS